MYRLGRMYEKGEGMPVDYAKAAYWYGKSADRTDFIGDEFLFDNKIVLNITLPEFAENMEHLEKVRSSFDTLYGGPGKKDGSVFDRYYEAAIYGILPDLACEPSKTSGHGPKKAAMDASGRIIYDRGAVRPGDSAAVNPEKTVPGDRETYTWNGFTVDFPKQDT